MDPKLIALIALRALGSVSGNLVVVEGIDKLRAAWEAGKDIDAHLAAIADKLEAGEELDDWQEITDRINAEVDDFLDEETVASNPVPEDDDGTNPAA